MDISGAVDLSVPATRLDLPGPPRGKQLERLERAAFSAGFNGAAETWAREQVVRLAIASVLEARLLNVRSTRLAAFEMAADPHKVTMRQLSALQRPHAGTAGQAFELAVSDAVEAQNSEVCGALRTALRQLNIPVEGRLGMVVLGLEKVQPDRRDDFWAGVRRQLPEDGVLRTGGRGRPRSVTTALAQLQEANWKSMRDQADQEPVSQLARCDAFITCGSVVVPVSFKINPWAARVWKDVPLHITGRHTNMPGPPRVGPPPSYMARNASGAWPAVLITFGGSIWYASFIAALATVDEVLDRLDGRPAPRRSRKGALTEGLVRSADLTIAEVCEMLRKMPPQMEELAAGVQAVRTSDTFPVADNKDLLQEWQDDGGLGRILNGQGHLFGIAS